MFNYIKETIINDAAKIQAATGKLLIKRAGEYELGKILDKKAYKTVGVTGQTAQATLTVNSAMTAGSLHRITLFVATPEKELVEFAYPNFYDFGKPFIVEFAAVGTSAAAEAANIARVLKLALQPDNAAFKVSVNNAVVTIELAENWMEVGSLKFASQGTDGEFVEDATAVTVNAAARANKVEFGTAKWLVENLRFPSYPNLRYNRMYADEAPVAGTLYNEYAFQYVVKHSVPGGVSGIGQLVDSLTTHVFYVPAGSAVETAFVNALVGITIESLNTTSAATLYNTAANDLAKNQGYVEPNVIANTKDKVTKAADGTFDTAQKLANAIKGA